MDTSDTDIRFDSSSNASYWAEGGLRIRGGSGSRGSRRSRGGPEESPTRSVDFSDLPDLKKIEFLRLDSDTSEPSFVDTSTVCFSQRISSAMARSRSSKGFSYEKSPSFAYSTLKGFPDESDTHTHTHSNSNSDSNSHELDVDETRRFPSSVDCEDFHFEIGGKETLTLKCSDLANHMPPNSVVPLPSLSMGSSRIQQGMYDGKKVILKISFERSNNEGGRAFDAEWSSFPHEYRMLCKISSPNVVRAIDCFVDTESKFKVLILEHCGSDLSRITLNTPEQLEQFLSVASQLASGLDSIHNVDIIHRDLCPSNIVYNSSNKIAKIIDFDVATSMPMMQGQLTTGTIAYMSPEQTGRVNRQIDYRTDFYSLGVTFYKVLTGKNPFLGEDTFSTLWNHLVVTPTPVDQILPHVPSSLAKIIGKMIAKSPEDRYQSATALQYDLDLVRRNVHDAEFNSKFVPGLKDHSKMFLISQEFVGREVERQRILDSIDRVRANGFEAIFIKGRSGIGKSALVEQIANDVAEMKGFFFSGKYQQSNMDVDYSAIVLALNALMKGIGEQSKDVEALKSDINVALGDDIGLISVFIPGMESVLGNPEFIHFNQPKADEAELRLKNGITQLFNCIARPDSPLVFFLDDLQWMDARSVEMLSFLLTKAGLKNILFIGSYRDNEVTTNSECNKFLEALENSSLYSETISLQGLEERDVDHILSDTLRLSEEEITDLASIVHSKAMGNPFFVKSLLTELYTSGHIHQSDRNGKWEWNILKVKEMNIQDNFAAEIVRTIQNHDEKCVQILNIIASCSSSPECCSSKLISSVLGLKETQMSKYFSELLNSYLILNCHQYFKCAHDGIQEAVFASLDSGVRKRIVYKIARYLKKSRSERKRILSIEFCENCVDLLSYPTECLEFAQLALCAAKEAKSSTAYGSCKKYLLFGIECLGDFGWSDHYDVWFPMQCELVHIEYILTNIQVAEEKALIVFEKAKTNLDKARLSVIFIMISTMRGSYYEAVNVGKIALELLGVFFPSDEKIPDAIQNELEMAVINRGDRTLDALLDSEPIMDEELMVEMEILLNIDTAAYFCAHPLHPLVIGKMVNLTLKHGIHPFGSAKSFLTYGMILGKMRNQYELGGEFCRLSLKLADLFGIKSERCKVYSGYGGFLKNWTRPLYSEGDTLDVAVQTGLESGELQFVGIAKMTRLLNALCLGKDLGRILDQISSELEFFEETKHQLALDTIRGLYLILYSMLTHHQPFSTIFCPDFSEKEYLTNFDDPNRKFSLAVYLSLKTKFLFLLGNFEEARISAESAISDMEIFTTCAGLFETADICMYHSLVLFSLCREAELDSALRTSYLKTIDENMKKLEMWKEGCKENFLHKYLLLKAELASLNSIANPSEANVAIECFNDAIDLSLEGEFMFDALVAKERFAEFWRSKGKKFSSKSCYFEAYSSCVDMGLSCKAQLLERLPFVSERRLTAPGLSTLSTSSSSNVIVPSGLNFDSEIITRATHTFMEKSNPEELVQAAMRILMANAGAQRGVMFVMKDGRLITEAVCEVDTTQTHLGIPLSQANSLCCVELVEESSRCRSAIIIEDALSDENYRNNSFVKGNQCRSMLSLPIINQAELLGILFLENRSMSAVFADEILTVLTLISSQLAVSLEIAIRFQKLADVNSLLRSSEQRFRVLIDSAPVGILLMDAKRNPVYLNEMISEITGLKIDNCELLWKDVLHPDRRTHVFDALSEDYPLKHVSMTEEMQISTIGGPSKWVNFYLTPLFSEHEEFTGSIIVMTDISAQKLLNAAIPKEIVTRMLQKPSLRPHHHAQTINDASIMFADIVGFTRLSEMIIPTQLVDQLNAVFSKFDNLINELDLTRLKIIGDCYMVVGGVLNSSPDHALRMAKLALRMREVAHKSSLNGNPIRLRIGICQGPVAGGVIGRTTNLVFDVWGRTVNAAKRLQEGCSVNDVCVFSSLGDSLEPELIVGPESVLHIPDLGSVITRCIRGDKFTLRRIVYMCFVRLHHCFPGFLEKHGERFSNILESLVLPAMECCANTQSFFAEHSESNTNFNSHKGCFLREADPGKIFAVINSIDYSTGADVDQVLKDGFSILQICVMLNSEDCVRWSLYLGTDQSKVKNGLHPIVLACKYADIEILRLLVQQYTSITTSTKCNENEGPKEPRPSPMFVAAAFGRKCIVEKFLEWDFDANMEDTKGISPLSVAVLYGHEEVVRVLCKRNKVKEVAESVLHAFNTSVSRSLHRSESTPFLSFDFLELKGFFDSFFPPIPRMSTAQTRLISWLAFRHEMHDENQFTISTPSPFECPSVSGPTTLQFGFAQHCLTPSMILQRNGRVLLLDCCNMSFTTVSTLTNNCRDVDFCVINTNGSHSKGLETHIFANFFGEYPQRPMLYIPERLVEPLWSGSISGGLSTCEGIVPTIRTFLEVVTLEKKDCLVWQGMRIWLEQVYDEPGEVYHVIAFVVNGLKVVIDTSPYSHKKKKRVNNILNFYEEADVIFANVAVTPGEDLEDLATLFSATIRNKMFTFSYEVDGFPVEGHGIRAIGPDRNNTFDLTKEIVVKKNDDTHAHDDDGFHLHMLKDLPSTSTLEGKAIERCSLFFIGVGSAFSDNNTNALITVNGNRLLIDCGGTYFCASRSVGLDPLAVDAVYISHLHLDHVGGLVDLVSARRRQRRNVEKLKLFLSPDLIQSSVTKTLWDNCLKTSLEYCDGKKCTIHDYFDVHLVSDFDWYGLTIELVKTDHFMDYDRVAPTYGFVMTIRDERLETCGKQVLFTTDTKAIPDVDRYCTPVDLIFHDCSLSPNPVHASIDELRRLPTAISKKVWLMHVEELKRGDQAPDVSKFRGIVRGGQIFDFSTLKCLEKR